MSKRQAVCAEAMTWLRTPYLHAADIKGVGVDCAMLVVRVYVAQGLAPADLDPRPYPPDWHMHRSEERYMGWVQRFGERVDAPLPGDVVMWKFGRAFSHGAIVLDAAGGIIHAYREAGCVVLGSMHETALKAREHEIYRINGIEG
jgi:cell wall-associated NlpC family hydrolase